MFIWGLGLGKPVSPNVSLSFPGPKEKTTAHVALSALQPHPMLPHLQQEVESSISSDGRFRERGLLLGTSNLSAPYCLVVTEISLDSQWQKSFCVSPLAVLAKHLLCVCREGLLRYSQWNWFPLEASGTATGLRAEMEESQTCGLLLFHFLGRFSVQSSSVQPEQLSWVSVQSDMQPLHRSVSSPEWIKSFVPLQETPCRSVTGLTHSAGFAHAVLTGMDTQYSSLWWKLSLSERAARKAASWWASGEPPPSPSPLFPISVFQRIQKETFLPNAFLELTILHPWAWRLSLLWTKHLRAESTPQKQWYCKHSLKPAPLLQKLSIYGLF